MIIELTKCRPGTGMTLYVVWVAYQRKKESMTDYYKCEKCGVIFDEFEMNYAAACIDKKTLCRKCREKEGTKKGGDKNEV